MRLRALILGFGAMALSLYAAAFAIDFSVYYPIANYVIADGGQPYGEASGLPWPMWFRYPPFFLFLVFPFTLVSFPVAAFLFTLPKCWVLYELVQRIRPKLSARPNWWIVVALAAPYVVLEFRYANVQFYVFALVVWALLAAVERPRWAAALLGTAIAIKIWPLFFVPYLAAQQRWRTAASALATALVLTMLPALYFGWSEHLQLLRDWYAQESSIAATAGTIWFPSQSLFGVLTRYFTAINYAAMPDPGYWNINLLSLSPELVRVVWVALTVVAYLALLAAAYRRNKGNGLHLHAIAFCLLVLLQPFSQKQSALVVLLLPGLVAGSLTTRAWQTWSARLIVTAAVISVLQPMFATGQWQRTFQLFGADALVVLLLLSGLLLHARPKYIRTANESSAAPESRRPNLPGHIRPVDPAARR